MKPTDARISYNWLTPAEDWSDATPKLLAATYVRLKSQTSSSDGRQYGGFVVRVYFDGHLQDSRANPSELLTLFPAEDQLTSPPNATPARNDSCKHSRLVSELVAGRGRPGSISMHRRRTLEMACPQAVLWIHEMASSLWSVIVAIIFCPLLVAFAQEITPTPQTAVPTCRYHGGGYRHRLKHSYR